MRFLKSVVGKLWVTIIGLVAVVLLILAMFLLEYIDNFFPNSYAVKRLFAYTGMIGFFLTTFLAFFLSTKITQPLRQMREAANRIKQGDYGTRVQYRSTDEIGELTAAFNHMAAQLEVTLRDLNHEKEHLASVLRSMADAVITFDAEGKVIHTNPQGEKIIENWTGIPGIETRETQSDRLNDLNMPEPLRSLFMSVVESTQELTAKLHVRNQVWSVVMAPLYSNDLVRGVVAVLRDVTEESKLDKLRKDFLANVSHELRTPLSMLQGYSDALLDDIAGTVEERREIAQIINDESLRMGRLLQDLLDMASMEAGQLKLSIDPMNVHGLANRVHRKFLAVAKERGFQLSLQLETAEGETIDADEDRMEQVLTNLLDNALRHTPAGGSVHLRIAKGLLHHLPALEIDVADNGQGIPPDDLQYIFERFYKADKARTRGQSGGTGLGLAIVKNIVDAHQGVVDVKSKVGHGTTFSIKIPIQQPK